MPTSCRPPNLNYDFFFDARALLFFLRALLRLGGTLAPAWRASESPIAMACLRLLTLRPERPLRSVPLLRSCIARETFFAALRPYFLAAMETPDIRSKAHTTFVQESRSGKPRARSRRTCGTPLASCNSTPSFKTMLSGGSMRILSGGLGAAAAALCVSGAVAMGADKGLTAESFVKQAAQDGMTEVELGNIAEQKASSQDVKTFASRMVQDH